MVSSKLVAATLLSAGGSAYAQDVYATFTVNCQPLTVQAAGPIVSPSADLSDHVHSAIAGTNFFAGTTPANALTSAATTCDTELDRSIYWVPQLYLHRGRQQAQDGRVQGIRQAVYYQNRACNYEPGRTSCPSYKINFAGPFSEGLQMVAGHLIKRAFDPSDIEQRAVNHLCFLRGGGSVQTNSVPLEQCIDIRSQMCYPDSRYGVYNGGVCPKSHPIAVITIFYEFFLNTSKYKDRNFVFARGDETGYGFHGDFGKPPAIHTDLQRLGDAHRTCTGREGIDAPSCSLNVGVNGTPDTATPRSPVAQLPGGKIPLGETPVRVKRSRVMAEEY
ncbi:hypothetical protein DL771_005561 [Monosporascus sp. 5C6A]|nr:hypothetical protein DL771_005561 [Monosporascus sp. 5C6A]